MSADLDHREQGNGTVETSSPGRAPRLIAFHLPQFHPIPENNAWWGEGFTEWTNVTKARPLFRGHDQPRLPADLGFYDLRLPEARAAQAELARAHGIEGFCYWHYWFEGRRLLERPVEEILASGAPDYPFCLAWANETWSRTWLGDDRQILLEQTYSKPDDEAHARWLTRAFADPRYLRVHGRPLFAIYKPMALPDARRTTDVLRAACVREGLPEPYLVGIDAHCVGTDTRDLGFDITLHFGPQLGVFLDGFVEGATLSKLKANLRMGVRSARLSLIDHDEFARRLVRIRPKFPYVPCCFVGWDNTPRRGALAIVVAGCDPQRFRRRLDESVLLVQPRPAEERLVFINAWNEWAEGNYLEPDRRNGCAYLEAVASVVAQNEPRTVPLG